MHYITIGVFIGIAVGCVVRNVNPSDDTVTLISFPGELFMRMLKMLIVPILFTSVVVGKQLYLINFSFIPKIIRL